MRVVVGPRTDPGSTDIAVSTARRMAAPAGEVVFLHQVGVRDLERPLSAAEVVLLREALGGTGPVERAHPTADGAVVGYVCRGVAVRTAGSSSAPGATALVDASAVAAATDHVNLTWRSPLTGPNDDSVGPRFPSMTGIYAPETVVERLAGEGIIVVPAVVAGVERDDRLSAYEAETVEAEAFQVMSSELVPVAIVAAHMGLRLAAVVVPAGS